MDYAPVTRVAEDCEISQARQVDIELSAVVNDAVLALNTRRGGQSVTEACFSNPDGSTVFQIDLFMLYYYKSSLLPNTNYS